MRSLPTDRLGVVWAQDLREVAQNELKQVEADLDRESREDGELRDRFQQRWARPASAALNSTLREKIAGAQAACVGGFCVPAGAHQ